MFRLDAATVLLQWAGGGLAFLWVTTRRREVGLGYGWLLRSVYLVMALGAVAAGFALETVPVREVASGLTATATATALGVSVVRRRAGVAGQRELRQRRQARVDAMVTAGATGTEGSSASDDGDLLDQAASVVDPVASATPGPGYEVTDIERRGPDDERDGEVTGIAHGTGSPGDPPAPAVPDEPAPRRRDRTVPTGAEFPPVLDLVAPVVALVGLVAAGVAAADGASTGDLALAVARTVVGAAFLGSVTDAMLLGHWYLVQPGLARGPLLELIRWVGWIWPAEVVLLLVPTGMVSVWNGTIDDGYAGMLGWFWAACAVTTIALVFVTRAALKERAYSAVMAATGLLYLAILTAFGTDLVARAVLAG